MLLKPAAPGTGIIAGGPVRALLELGGRPRRAQQVARPDNALNMVKAAAEGLKSLASPEEIARRRGKTVGEVHGRRGDSATMARARRSGSRRSAAAIGLPRDQKATVRALGIKRMHDTVEQADTPAIRGMIFKVKHLVEVEEI